LHSPQRSRLAAASSAIPPNTATPSATCVATRGFMTLDLRNTLLLTASILGQAAPLIEDLIARNRVTNGLTWRHFSAESI